MLSSGSSTTVRRQHTASQFEQCTAPLACLPDKVMAEWRLAWHGVSAPEGRHLIKRGGSRLDKGPLQNGRTGRQKRTNCVLAHGTPCPHVEMVYAGAAPVSKRTGLQGRLFRSMVGSPTTCHLGIRMSDSSKPLSAATIHSVYSGKKITSVVEQAKHFKSTNSFARDSSHSGQAPEKPKTEKSRPQR